MGLLGGEHTNVRHVYQSFNACALVNCVKVPNWLPNSESKLLTLNEQSTLFTNSVLLDSIWRPAPVLKQPKINFWISKRKCKSSKNSWMPKHGKTKQCKVPPMLRGIYARFFVSTQYLHVLVVDSQSWPSKFDYQSHRTPS